MTSLSLQFTTAAFQHVSIKSQPFKCKSAHSVSGEKLALYLKTNIKKRARLQTSLVQSPSLNAFLALHAVEADSLHCLHACLPAHSFPLLRTRTRNCSTNTAVQTSLFAQVLLVRHQMLLHNFQNSSEPYDQKNVRKKLPKNTQNKIQKTIPESRAAY